MTSSVRVVLTACLAAAIATGAAAGPFPRIAFMGMGFSEASMDMLKGTPNFTRRQSDPSGFLSVSADFNGDGRIDEARILVNPTDGQLRIVAVIQSAAKVDTYVLRILPIGALPTVGIRLAPAGIYEAACPPCSTKQITTSRPGIILFEFDGPARLETHPSDNTDDDFQSVPIKS